MDDYEEEETFEFDNRGTFAYLLLIDASKCMYEEQNGSTLIAIALDACIAMLRQAMISAPKHLFGVSLYGVRQNDEPNETLMKLKEPAVEDVENLQRLKSQLRLRYGALDSGSLLQAFRHSIREFNSCTRKMRVKRVNVISRMADAPSDGDATLKTAPDLGSIAELNLIPIGSDSHEYELHDFYTKLLAASYKTTLEEVIVPTIVREEKEIVPLLWQESHKLNASAIIKLELGEGVVVGVGLYRLCSAQKPLKKVRLERTSNDVVIPTRATNDVITTTADEKRTVLRSETCVYQDVGGEKVSLTNPEHTQLKKFSGAPKMTLLGFKSADLLNKERWYLESCSFMYPNDGLIEGSSLLLNVLLNRCRELNKVALCIVTPRWCTHPKLVALVPTQAEPDGFHLVYIPYQENVRDLEFTTGEREPTAQQIDCMKSIVKKLKFHFTPGHFANPKLQKQYAAVEALALAEEVERDAPDETEPDVAAQDERIGRLARDFHNLFGELIEIKPVKAAKMEPTGEPPDLQMLVSRIQNNKVDKYTVPQLKEVIRWKKPHDSPALTGLKKKELVDLVYKFCTDL